MKKTITVHATTKAGQKITLDVFYEWSRGRYRIFRPTHESNSILRQFPTWEADRESLKINLGNI